MSKSNKFSPEVRERAVRMVQEPRGEYPPLWAAAPKIGCVPQTLHEWVKRVEVDTGVRVGVTSVGRDANLSHRADARLSHPVKQNQLQIRPPRRYASLI